MEGNVWAAVAPALYKNPEHFSPNHWRISNTWNTVEILWKFKKKFTLPCIDSIDHSITIWTFPDIAWKFQIKPRKSSKWFSWKCKFSKWLLILYCNNIVCLSRSKPKLSEFRKHKIFAHRCMRRRMRVYSCSAALLPTKFQENSQEILKMYCMTRFEMKLMFHLKCVKPPMKRADESCHALFSPA